MYSKHVLTEYNSLCIRLISGAPMLKTVGTVNGLKDGSVTFQIGDALSLPPYPTPTITIAGDGTLTLAQIEYNHPNVTLSSLTEANSERYVLTVENSNISWGIEWHSHPECSM